MLPDAVLRYHDGTKHHFQRFARSLGYLDWASQPNPFRSFPGTAAVPLWPGPDAQIAYDPAPVTYTGLFGDEVQHPAPLNASSLGDLLRHACGLSAWKVFQSSRWSLRVNPSSGNLHPTEAYVVCSHAPGLAPRPGVYHYAADRHVLETRCQFDEDAWQRACGDDRQLVLVVLTSIHWREAWKYGERAFRYCQHDLGHAIAAVSIAARLTGWRTHAMPAWSHQAMATLIGLDRDEDFADREREEPGAIVACTPADQVPPAIARADPEWVDAVRGGEWAGQASQLSEDHVQWTFIDEIAAATRWPGLSVTPATSRSRARQREAEGLDRSVTGERGWGPASSKEGARQREAEGLDRSVTGERGWGPASSKEGARQRPSAVLRAAPSGVEGREAEGRDRSGRAIILQRRSAVAFDGRTRMGRATFLSILRRAMPGPFAPWDAIWWTPRVHLVIFVHRVDELDPGLYILVRHDEEEDGPAPVEPLRAACGRDFLWERADGGLPLFCLARGECASLARRLSCDQDIAADGCFSLGMLADFERSLAQHGAAFYRHLFWETGVVGQVLYLEAEAAGVRATGIGCFYDDPVHDVLGLQGHAFQSLYHFTIGGPVEDMRLTTESGYPWG